MGGKPTGVPKRGSRSAISYPSGTALVSFMLERGLIYLKLRDVDSRGDNTTRVKMKKGNYYRSSALFVECKLDPSFLPMKLRLPMVCYPEEWSYDANEVKSAD